MHGADHGIGHEIGFRISGNHACDWRNRMTYVTDGTLINWLVRGELDRISMVVIDEAHERSLNIDVILALLTRCLPQYPHLKMVIVSATIDHERFRRHFDQRLPGKLRCGIVKCTGSKPAELSVQYRDPGTGLVPYVPGVNRDLGRDIADQLASAIVRLVVAMDGSAPLEGGDGPRGEPLTRGDVLGFLHGAQPIDHCVEQIQAHLKKHHPSLHANTDIYPLYSAVDAKTQKLATDPKRNPSRRRIVIASNAAETSLTIGGLVHVVESGFIKQTRWDPVLEQSPLLPIVHSQAGCRQRWGRVGRITDGWAWCLYSRDQFQQAFPPDTTPEIQRACVDGVVLSAKRGGADAIDAQTFPWLDAPDAEEIGRTLARLQRQGAIDGDGDLTELGVRTAMAGGEDAIYNRLIADADRFGFGVEVATLIPLVKAGFRDLFPDDHSWDPGMRRNVREAQARVRAACGDDLELALRIYEDWARLGSKARKSWPRRHGIDGSVLEEAETGRKALIRQLGARKKGMEDRDLDFAGLDRLRAIAVRAFPDQLYALTEPATLPDGREVVRYLPVHADGHGSTTPLEIGRASNCANAAPAPPVILALGPKGSLPPRGNRERVHLAPFVVAIDPAMAEAVVHADDVELAHYLQDHHTRPTQQSEEDRRLLEHERLRREYPVGSIVNSRVIALRKGHTDVRVTRLVRHSDGPALSFGTTEGRRERTVDRRESRAGAEWRRNGKGGGSRAQGVAPEEHDLVTEAIEADEELASNAPQGKGNQAGQPRAQKVFGRLVTFGAVGRIDSGDEVQAEVTRHTDLTGRPALILVSPPARQRFEAFARKYRVGQDVQVEVLGLAPPSSLVRGLLVRDVYSGLEIVVPPQELALSGKEMYLERIPTGMRMTLRVEHVDRQDRDVWLTATRHVDPEIARLHATVGKTRVEGTVLQVDEDDDRSVYVRIAVPGTHLNGAVPIRVKVIMGRDRFENPDQPVLPYQRGDRVHLALRVDETTNGGKQLPSSALTGAERAALQAEGIVVANGRLRCTGRLPYAARDRIVRKARSAQLVEAIRDLYQRSNSLMADWVLTDLEQRYPVGTIAEGKVKAVAGSTTWVALPEGISGVILAENASWWRPIKRVKDLFDRGDVIQAKVLGVDVKEQKVQLSVKDMTDDPWASGGIRLRYPMTQDFVAEVKTVQDKFAFVTLEPWLDGFVYVTDMKALNNYNFIENVRTVLAEGQWVKVRVIEYDLGKKRLKLSIQGRARRPATKPRAVAAPQAEPSAVPVEAEDWLEGAWPWTDGENAIPPEQPQGPPPAAPRRRKRPAIARRGRPSRWHVRR